VIIVGSTKIFTAISSRVEQRLPEHLGIGHR